MNKIKRENINKDFFNNRLYKFLNKTIILIYVLFILVYMFRGELYKLDNQYITLFAWIAPNLIPSFLFTMIGIFYIVPRFFKDVKAINNCKFVWFINVLNILVFVIIEYLHVIFKLGVWDNKDMLASLVGIIFTTIVYFRLRKFIND